MTLNTPRTARLLPFLVLSFLVLNGCDSNDSGDDGKAELIGSYEIHSITDKNGDFFGESAQGTTLVAGEETSIDGANTSFTGTFTFTQETYSWNVDVAQHVPLGGTASFNQAETGTWSVSGSTVTFTNPFNDPENRTMTFSKSGSQVTLTDSKTTFVITR